MCPALGTGTKRRHIMDQRSKNKVKLFRTLKVVFYCLGLPLFIFAVIITAATEYVGEFAYAGLADTELFASMKVLFNGTALYGVWVAAGVWLLIAIVHIILVKTVKNRRARTMLVGIVTLVAMLAPVVVMDLVLPVTLDKIAADAPEGVTIASYEDEKGHFYTRTSASWTADGKYESNNYYFITGVEDFLRTYNIGMGGGTKSGVANNTSNVPVRFGDLYIEGEGAPYADSAFANKVVKSGTTVTVNGESATVSDSTEQLIVDGTVFADYYYGTANGLWYRTSATAQMGDGVYGYASYNSNGMLSDGYVYGIDVALEILEDYYYSQKRMTELSNEATLGGYTIPSDAEIKVAAAQAREKYYSENGAASGYEKWLWNKQTAISEDFSLTQAELETVLDALGGAIGDALGDELVALLGSLSGILGLVNLGEGVVIEKTDNGMVVNITSGETTTRIAIEVAESASMGGERVLTIALSGTTFGDGVYELGLDSRLISGLSDLLDSLVANANILRNETTKATYQTVAEIVYDVLNGGGTGTIGTVGTIFGLVGGLISIIGDITGLITIEADADGNVTTSTEDMLYGIITNLLQGLYWYSSSEIRPVYDFYIEGLASLGVNVTSDDAAAQAAAEYAEQLSLYDRAVYEGGMHGYMIGSVIIPGSSLIAGDTLGNGSYSSTVPASYEEVMQFKIELSYKKWLYPLLGVRECLVCFVPFVVLFILLSGMAAEKEMLYATGQESAKKTRKQKKQEKEAAAAAVGAAGVAEDVQAAGNVPPEERTEPLVSENNDKEVL